MAQAGAVILGLSLIIAGFALVGDALGWWKVPGDFWGAVIVLLGAGGRFVSNSMSTKTAAENPPPQDKDDDEPPPPPAVKSTNSAHVAIVFGFWLAGCAGVDWKPAAQAWASCTGGGALVCLPEAKGEPEQAAIAYSACLAAQGIKCAGPLVAAQNPPAREGSGVAAVVDAGCVKALAHQCLELAREEVIPRSEYRSPSCIEAAVAICYKEQL